MIMSRNSVVSHIFARTGRHFLTRTVHARLFSSVPRPNSKAQFIYHGSVDGVNAELQPRIAGRQWLPGSTYPGHKLPDYLACPRENRPALYKADASEASIQTWAERARVVLDEKLHEYGTILFRGLPLMHADDFSRFFKAIGYETASYKGGNGSRHEVTDMVFTASDNDPPVYTIEPHNEMSYSNNSPKKIIFFCEHPATPGCGGESVVVDVRDILPRLRRDIVDKFDKLGLLYYNYVECKNKGDNSCPHRSWQQTFQCEDKNDVSAYVGELGFKYRWEEDDSLLYWYGLPAFRRHPLTGERIWFNQATTLHASYFFDHPKFVDADIPNWRYPYHCTYGDGSEIEPDVVQHIRDLVWQVASGFQMQKSDVLVYDNFYSQHARIGFTGKRKMLVSLAND